MKNNITVFFDDSVFGTAALAHAQKLAQVFDTEIIPIYLDKKTNLQAAFSEAEKGETLFFVVPVAQSKKDYFFNVKKARKWIRRSRVPVLTVDNSSPKETDYQQVVLPLDINCQDKELALWASYFPSYFQKKFPDIPKDKLIVHIIFNQYKDELLRKKVENNVAFVTKMFKNMDTPYQLHPFNNIENIHTFGLKFAQQTGNSLMLFLMTEHYSLIDLLFGPIENRILGNREQIPVLCLNAREDIFVLCQ